MSEETKEFELSDLAKEPRFITCEQDHEFSPEIDKIGAALCKAQAKFEKAKKSTNNPFYNKSYADLSEVIDVTRGPLTENGIAVIQLPYSKDHYVGCKTLLLHASGQWISCMVTFTLTKLDPQSSGSAITYARRYTLAAMVGISQEDDDGNITKPAPGEAAPAKKPNGKPPVKQPEAKPAAQAAPPVEEKPVNPVDEAGAGEPLKTITKEEAAALITAAKKNGWTKPDLMGSLDSLGYTNIIDLNTWDYEDVLKTFSSPKPKEEK